MKSKFSLCISLFVILLAGCSQNSDQLSLTPVRGKVTYQGEIIHDGVIRLIPIKGNQAPARTTQIKKGLYQFAERSAVKPGTYQVEIDAYRGGASLPGDKTENSTEREQFLPEQFNKKTTIETFTVKPNSNEIKKDFDLK